MLFSNMGFSFGESFGLIWVKLQKKLISLANFHFRYFKRYWSQVWAIFLLILSMKEVLGKFGQKLQKDPLDMKISILVLVSQVTVCCVIETNKKF